MIYEDKHGKLAETKTKYEFFIQTDDEKFVTVNVEDKERGTEYDTQAICHDGDKFNLVDGIGIAVERATKRFPKTVNGLAVGDKVKIVKDGHAYAFFEDWIVENVPVKYRKYWRYGGLLTDEYRDRVYRLVAIGKWFCGETRTKPNKYLGYIVDKEYGVSFIVSLEKLEKI